MSADRDLFLHEFIDIKGMHQWDYMEHTRQQAGDEKVDFELLGTWYTMGITARWPQVVNVWEIPDGWDGWFGKVDRLRTVHVADGRTKTRTFIAVAAGKSFDEPAKCRDECRLRFIGSRRCRRDFANRLL